MARILLDTNVAIKAMKKREPILLANLGAAIDYGHTLFMSTISLLELQVGVLRNSNVQTAIEKRKSFFKIITGFWGFDEQDAWLAAELRAEQLRIGNAIGAYDILIAAQAVRHDVLLVTSNAREFSRIAGFRWEDWTQE
jgi:tRNA(fMet)-specific endonuclease VapC